MIALRTFVRNLATERSLNRVTLIGRAGSQPQLKGTVENPVVIFSLATNSLTKTEWHKISIFKPSLRSLAENYIKSGNRLFVEGRLNYGQFVDSSGNVVPTTSIIAEEIIFLSKPKIEQEQDEFAEKA